MADSKAGNALGSVTTIVTIAPADQDAMDTAIQALQATHTVAAISGVAGGTVHVALQGTGAYDAVATEVCVFAD
jgi:hypothetical protein